MLMGLKSSSPMRIPFNEKTQEGRVLCGEHGRDGVVLCGGCRDYAVRWVSLCDGMGGKRHGLENMKPHPIGGRMLKAYACVILLGMIGKAYGLFQPMCFACAVGLAIGISI